MHDQSLLNCEYINYINSKTQIILITKNIHLGDKTTSTTRKSNYIQRLKTKTTYLQKEIIEIYTWKTFRC